MGEPEAPNLASAAERAEMVEAILVIWREVMHGREMDADSSLADLGASSLTAVRIRSRIRTSLGKEVELLDILEHPTPRALAEVALGAPTWEGLRPWHAIDWSTEGQAAPDGEAR